MPSAILRLTPHGGFRVGSRGATPRLEATISTSRPPDLAGNDHTLSKEIAGRVALIDLWGSWCASCRKHSKELIPLYDKYKDRGFTVVGVAREYDNADAMKTAIRRDGYPWLNLLELDDRLGIWKRYGIGNAGGGRFLVGRDGKILAINPDAAQVEAILEDWL